MTQALLGGCPGIIRDVSAQLEGVSGATCNGSGVYTVNNNGGTIDPQCLAFSKAVRWRGAYAYTMSDWGDAAGTKMQICFISLGDGGALIRRLAVFKVSSTKYTVDLMDNSGASVAASTTQFDFGTAYTWLVETDGSTLRVYWGDLSTPVHSVSYAYDMGANFGAATSSFNNHGSGTYSVQWPFQAEGDASDARPDPTTIGVLSKKPTSGTPQHDDHTYNEAGTPATNKWLSVDEWDTTTTDDGTTYLKQPATVSTTFRQTFKTTGGTFTKSFYCAFIYARAAAEVGGKSLTWRLINANATQKREGASTVLGSTTYANRALVDNLAATGSPFTQTDIDNWEIGHRWDVGTSADDPLLTTIQGAIMGFNLQAVAAADRRRLLMGRAA